MGMPRNWDDHRGWERHFAGLVRSDAGTGETGWGGLSRALRFGPFLASNGLRRIWMAGCGLDSSSRVYAALGFDVSATDIAPSAVKAQQRLADLSRDAVLARAESSVEHLLPLMEGAGEGRFSAFIRDFRTPFPEGPVDAVLNIKAFQALPPASTEAAASSHFQALRPGGQALFDTQNVQGERRDRLEDTLIRAGFHIPGNGAERWYRKVLAETGIEHVFVLGRPMVPMRGISSTERQERQELLWAFTPEYRERCRAEQEELDARLQRGPVTVARVIYNTG
jgi:hypothetical protein